MTGDVSSAQVCEPVKPGELRSVICQITTQLCAEELGDRLRAIVLTGSLARDEATFVSEEKRWTLLGDIEFLLVFAEHASLPPSLAIESLRQKIEDGLSGRGIICHLGLSAVHPQYLRKVRPHIFAYELRTHGQVVWGEPQILSLMPAFSSSDIPLEDAWRLLSNRMVELLEVAGQWLESPGVLSRDVHYRAIKLYLDMATSFLLFQGAYEPTYQGRAHALRLLYPASEGASRDRAGRFPFDLQGFSDRVSACTALKLGQESSLGHDLASELNGGGNTLSLVSCHISADGELGNPRSTLPSPPWGRRAGGEGVSSKTDCDKTLDAIECAHQLWRWELARLTRVEGRLSDRELLRKWIELQPLGKRLRGWAYVLRKCRWHRSWRHWPHWLRRGWRASPRYSVYAAAAELFFRLPGLLRAASHRQDTDSDWRELLSWLPVAAVGACPGRDRRQDSGLPSRAGSERRYGWRQVASEIAWNYHEFVEGTRA